MSSNGETNRRPEEVEGLQLVLGREICGEQMEMLVEEKTRKGVVERLL